MLEVGWLGMANTLYNKCFVYCRRLTALWICFITAGALLAVLTGSLCSVLSMRSSWGLSVLTRGGSASSLVALSGPERDCFGGNSWREVERPAKEVGSAMFIYARVPISHAHPGPSQ